MALLVDFEFKPAFGLLFEHGHPIIDRHVSLAVWLEKDLFGIDILKPFVERVLVCDLSNDQFIHVVLANRRQEEPWSSLINGENNLILKVLLE